MSNERVQLLVAELGKELGLPGMKLDDEQVCLIGTDRGLDVVLNYVDDDDMLIVYCDLGPVPSGSEERLYPELLKANFGWLQTRGTTLSVSGRRVILQTYVACDGLELDPALVLLENFFQRAAQLTDAIRDELVDVQGDEPQDDNRVDPGMFV